MAKAQKGEIHEVIDAPTHVNGVTIKGGGFVADGEYEIHHKATAWLPNGVIAVFSDEQMRDLAQHLVSAKSNK